MKKKYGFHGKLEIMGKNPVEFEGYIFPIIYYYYSERDQVKNKMKYEGRILTYRRCNENN